MPLPPAPPSAKDGSGPCCRDCAAAETVLRVVGGMDWEMARTTVGNERLEQLRLPGVRLGMGLLAPSEAGDLDGHYDWLVSVGLWERP